MEDKSLVRASVSSIQLYTAKIRRTCDYRRHKRKDKHKKLAKVDWTWQPSRRPQQKQPRRSKSNGAKPDGLKTRSDLKKPVMHPEDAKGKTCGRKYEHRTLSCLSSHSGSEDAQIFSVLANTPASNGAKSSNESTDPPKPVQSWKSVTDLIGKFEDLTTSDPPDPEPRRSVAPRRLASVTSWPQLTYCTPYRSPMHSWSRVRFLSLSTSSLESIPEDEHETDEMGVTEDETVEMHPGSEDGIDGDGDADTSLIEGLRDDVVLAMNQVQSVSNIDRPTPSAPPQHEPSPMYAQYAVVNKDKKKDVSPLAYTLSEYRRMATKNSPNTTPAVSVVTPRRPIKKSAVETPTETQQRTILEELRKKLETLTEDYKTESVKVTQLNQAMTVCRSKAENAGSDEEVEVERLLLLATLNRDAVKQEIRRLQSVIGERGPLELGPFGNLSISKVKVQLKNEFINNVVKPDYPQTYHFLFVLRFRDLVVHSDLLRHGEWNSRGELEFKNYIQMINMPAEFKVDFDVYTLKVAKNQHSHEERFKTNRKNQNRKEKSLSALFSLVSSSTLHRDQHPSPTSIPVDVTRHSAFQMIGTLPITLRTVSSTRHSLSQVPFNGPIEPYVHMQVMCHTDDTQIEHEGFLNLQQNFSGYQAWDRRWCRLQNGIMKCWRYPDDEETGKQEMGYLDLHQCTTQETGIVSQERCPKANTFFLEFSLPLDHKEPSKGTQDVITLLSADTAEECREWCNKINQVLHSSKRWNPSVAASHAEPQSPSKPTPAPRRHGHAHSTDL